MPVNLYLFAIHVALRNGFNYDLLFPCIILRILGPYTMKPKDQVVLEVFSYVMD